MAEKKTTRISGGISRGQMPHPLVWYIRFREEGSDSEIAKRYFTTSGKIRDIRRNKNFKYITENATFSAGDIDKARDEIKKNFTKNSNEVTLKDAAYSLAKLDELISGVTNLRQARKSKADSVLPGGSSAVTKGQDAAAVTATASATGAKKADKREKISERPQNMGVMPDTDAPAPATPPKKSLLNMRVEFIFVALAVMFLVIFLAFFSRDDVRQPLDDAATADLTKATDSGGQAGDGVSGSSLPQITPPPEAEEKAASEQSLGPVEYPFKGAALEGRFMIEAPASEQSPSTEGHSPVVGMATPTEDLSATRESEETTDSGSRQATDSTDSANVADISGQQSVSAEPEATAIAIESTQAATPNVSDLPIPFPPPPSPSGAATAPPPPGAARQYPPSVWSPQAPAYNRWQSYRPAYQPPRSGFQPPPPASQRRQRQSQTGWRW